MLVPGTENLIFASPLRWTPSLTLSERYNDNIFLVSQNKTSDHVTLLVPQLDVSSLSSPHTRNIRYRSQIERYASTPELNNVKHFTNLEWNTSLTKSSTLTFTDDFSFTPDSDNISSLGIVAPRGNAYRNDSTVQFQFSGLDLSYQYGLQAFDLASLNDSQSHTLAEQVTLPLSAYYGVTQSYRFRYFIQGGDVVFRSHTVGPGLRYQFSPTFSMGAGGGVVYWRGSTDDTYRSQRMVSLDLQKTFKALKFNVLYLRDVQTEWKANVTYTLRNTVFLADYSRGLTAGGGLLGGAVNRQTAKIQLQHALGQKIGMTLSATYSTSRPSSNGQNRFSSYQADAAFAYVIRSWLRTNVQYNYFKQDSDNPGQQEITRNQVTLTLSATLP